MVWYLTSDQVLLQCRDSKTNKKQEDDDNIRGRPKLY